MDDDIRTTLQQAVPPTSSRLDLDGAVERGRKLRDRRRFTRAVVGCAAITLVVVFVTVPLGGNDHSATTSVRPSGTTLQAGQRGISIDVPSDWQVAPTNLTPHLGGRVPWEVVSLGTGRLQPNDDQVCAQLPVRAIRDMSSSDAFVSVQEAVDYGPSEKASMPPRPSRLAPETGYLVGTQSDFSECLGPTPAITLWTFGFVDHGRAIVVFVAVGDNASAARQADAWNVANSLQVQATSS